MKTVVSTCARVKVFTTSCCFSKALLFKRNSTKYQDPAEHVSCDLTSQSTMFSRVGISALLSWDFTGNVLSKFVVCLIISYLTLRPTQKIW